MANYTVTTNFGAKDSLPSGNAGKLIKGTEFTTEFNNIATAVATKADTTTVTALTATVATKLPLSGGAITGNLSVDGITTLEASEATSSPLVVFKAATLEAGKINTHTVSGNAFFSIGNEASGLRFIDYQTTRNITPYNVQYNVDSDNIIDLGAINARFDDIYATNATIQTSDRNEKQSIAELSEAETRVAVACKGLLRKFRWNSAVEAKGNEARTHFGIIAQDLQDAFEAEGLDAGDYAMFTSSTWTNDEGIEQTRLGVRYAELLAFIIGGI